MKAKLKSKFIKLFFISLIIKAIVITLVLLSSCIRVNVHPRGGHNAHYKQVTVLQINDNLLYFSFNQSDNFTKKESYDIIMDITKSLCSSSVEQSSITGPWEREDRVVYLLSCDVNKEYLINYIKFFHVDNDIL
jgi:hypothetical protein